MPRGIQNAGRMAVLAAALATIVVAVPSALADRNPGVPGGVATNRSDTTVTLSWSAPAGGAAAYEVETDDRRTTTQQLSVTFSRLECGKRYRFDVRALDVRGHRSDAARLTVTGPCDTTPPSQPQDLVVSGYTAKSLTIRWKPSTDNVDVTGYEVKRSGDDDTVHVGGPPATFAGLKCGTAYTLTVVARDAARNRSAPATLTASTSACPNPKPAPIQGLAATSATTTSITLTWLASTGVVGYELRWKPRAREDDDGDGDGDGDERSTLVTAPPYTVGGLRCGLPYRFRVVARDALGRRSAPSTLLARTGACPTGGEGVAAPAGLAVTALAQTSATVGWQPVSGATSYAVVVDGGASVAATTTAYTSAGFTCATAHTFSVIARNNAGITSPPATLAVTAAPCDAANLWIDDNGGTCTRVAIATAYQDAAACATFQAALDAAQAGDTVLAGCRAKTSCTFAAEQLTGDRVGTADLLVAAAPGSTVSFDAPAGSGSYVHLENLHHVTFQNIGFGHNDLGNGAPNLRIDCTRNVTLVNASGRRFGMFEGNANVTFKGGDWGGYADPGEEDSTMGTSGATGPQETCAGDSSPQPQRNILFDGVTWHDVFWNVPCTTVGACAAWGAAHPDCFEINGYVDGVTIQNSTFYHCGNTMLSLFTDQGPIDNVVVKNNVFRDMAPSSYWGIQWTDTGPFTCSGDKFLNNTYMPNAPAAWLSNAPPRFECNLAPGGVPTEVAGNTFQQAPPPEECLISKTGNPTDSPPKTYRTYWHGNVFLAGTPCVS